MYVLKNWAGDILYSVIVNKFLEKTNPNNLLARLSILSDFPTLCVLHNFSSLRHKYLKTGYKHIV